MNSAEKFGIIAATLQNLVKLTGDERVTFRLKKITSDVGIAFDDAQIILKRLATKEKTIKILELYYANPERGYVELDEVDAKTALDLIRRKEWNDEQWSEWATNTLVSQEYFFDEDDKITVKVDTALLAKAVRNFDSENKSFLLKAAEDAYRSVFEYQDAIKRVQFERGEIPALPKKEAVETKELAEPKPAYLSPTTPSTIKIALEQRYKAISGNAKSNWDFFLYIADYVQFVDQTKGMSGYIALIQEERENDHKMLKDLEKKLMSEIEAVREKLDEIVSGNETFTKLVSKDLQEYDDYKQGRLLSSQPLAESLHEKIVDAVQTLFYKGHKNKLTDFIEVDSKDPSEIHRYIFAPTIDGYAEEKESVGGRKKTSLWFAWNELTLAYVSIYRAKSFYEDLQKEGRRWDAYNLQGIVHEMGEIRDGKDVGLNRQPVQFIRSDYEQYILRMHNFFVEQLLSAEEIANKKDRERRQLQEAMQNRKSIYDFGFDHNLNRIDPQRDWMQQQAIETGERSLQRSLDAKRHRENLKQQRVFSTKEDRRVHAINVIIERTESIVGRKKDVNIDYHHFNYEDDNETVVHVFMPFLQKLKEADCFTSFERNTGVNQVRFSFHEINIDKLLQYRTGLSQEGLETHPIKKQVRSQDIVTIKNESINLSLNTKNGDALYNTQKGNLNPQSQEFKVLYKLLTDDNHVATYDDLLGPNASINSKRKLTFVIRNLKESLGILSKKGVKNKDIIKNVKM